MNRFIFLEYFPHTDHLLGQANKNWPLKGFLILHSLLRTTNLGPAKLLIVFWKAKLAGKRFLGTIFKYRQAL